MAARRKESPYTQTERIALVTAWLIVREGVTTREIADALGIGVQGAAYMLARISRVLPVTFRAEGSHRRVWYLCSREKDS